MHDAPETADEALDRFPLLYARTARFTHGTPRTFQVVGDGRRVLFLRSESATDPTLCLWVIEVDHPAAGDGGVGAERLLVDPRALGAGDGSDLPAAERARRERARESASGIVAYSVDASGGRCCFALAGELFVVDVESGAVRSLPTPGAVFDPRFDRAGTAVAYTSGTALRVCELGEGDDDGEPVDRLLRHDDDPLVSHGRAEFVAAEEMRRSRGFWWAPDGSALLATRVDEGPVASWWIADPAHPERPPTEIRYPAAGTANAAVSLELVALDGSVTPIDWGASDYEYLADVVWSPGHDPLVVRQTRDQRTVSIAEIDPTAGGAVTERYRIEDDVWVELIPGTPRWSAAGLVTVEDRGPARRLVVDGHSVTGPGHQVRSVVGIVGPTDRAGSPDEGTASPDEGTERTGGADEGTGGSDERGDGGGPGGAGPNDAVGGGDERAAATVAVITASGADPTEIQLYAVPLAGGEPVALTTVAGVHGGVVGGGALVVTEATTDRPGSRARVERLDVGALSARRASADGPSTTAIESRSTDPGFPAEPEMIALGPDRLAAAVFLPRDHDGTTPLPVLLDPYGGPHAQRAVRAHNPHLVSRWLAEQGYAVIVADGRGTPGRGPAWERAVWGDLAGPVLDDQLAALDAALERWDHLDGDRVAIRGWSFGGYLAALAVLRRPDRFHAAIAGAPVTAWGLYDTHYTERYLGRPDTHPEHYRRSDLIPDLTEVPERGDEHGGDPPLTRLRRPLLLIHGLADDNVVAAHTLRFSTALLASGSPHRVLPLSGVTHMTPQEAVAENLLRLQLDFLDETIGHDAATEAAERTVPGE